MDNEKVPSYAGSSETSAGELEVAATSLRVESRGDVGKLTLRGLLDVVAVTRYLPPSVGEVRLTRESILPLVVCIISSETYFHSL